jgi:hypothetical protein
MSRLSTIAIFYEIKNLEVRNKCKKVAEIARQININISEEGVRLILIKWRSCKNLFNILIIKFRLLNSVVDRAKSNIHNWKVSRKVLLEINKSLLENPNINSRCLKNRLNLVASVQTIRRYVQMLGWRIVDSKYCQIISCENRVKRYVFGYFCKIFNEKFDSISTNKN